MYSTYYPGESRWRDCQNCGLADNRRNVVLTRRERIGPASAQLPDGTRIVTDPKGRISATYQSCSRTIFPFLVIGEAPGRTEDSVGLPFVGTSRKILRQIFQQIRLPAELVITNLVSCRPTDERGRNRPPSPQEIERCRPKLKELFSKFQYIGVIYVGVAATNFKTKLPTHKMLHPAAIARKEYKLFDIKEQALLLNRFIEKVYVDPPDLSRKTNSGGRKAST